MLRKIPVLLVDEMVLCEQTKPLFADSRFELHCYHDADEAKAGLNASRFEVAVADLRAATVDGSFLLEHIIDAKIGSASLRDTV